MSKNKSIKVPFSIILSTVFIAVFCDIKTINSYLVAGIVDEDSGPMALLYMVSAIGAFFSGILFSQWKGRKFSKPLLFIIIWVTLFYLITNSFIGRPFTTFIFFAVLTLVSFLLPSITQINARLFLRLSMILSIPAVFRIDDIFVFARYSDTISMGQSYAFLFPVVASIVYLFVYFKDDSFLWKVISIVLFLVNGVYAYYLVFFGSRGPVFALISLVFFLLVFRHSEEENRIRSGKGRFAIATTFAIVVLFSFVTLMSFLQDVMGDYGISLGFVDKFLSLGDKGDMSNGRQDLFAISFADIIRNPIFGMGFDQFYNNHGNNGLAYPHNFIIQILYDGGIVLFLVLGIPIWKGLKKVWKSCSKDEYAVVVALAFGSIPRALFSGDLWQNGPLWMFFGILLCEKFVVSQYLIDKKIINYLNNERIS